MFRRVKGKDFLSVVTVVSKFFYKNSIIMYHIKVNNQDYIISNVYLTALVAKLNISTSVLDAKLFKRVNVDMVNYNDNCYKLKKDSNSQDIINFYGLDKVYGCNFPTGINLEYMIRHNAQHKH